MRHLLAQVTLLCLLAPVYAADPTLKKIPPAIEGGDLKIVDNPVPAGSFAELRFKLDMGDTVQWEISPEPVKQVNYTDKDTGVLLFNGQPGSYTVTAFLINFDAKKFERRKIVVTIGTPAPTPPTPPSPTPSDELKGKIKVAFQTDNGTKADAVQLSALYKQASKLCGDKKKAPSSKELLRQVREASEGLIGADTLPSVRAVVADELTTILSTPSDGDLEDSKRVLAADIFMKLAAALDSLTQ